MEYRQYRFFNRNSVTMRLVMIGMLTLVLMIPSAMINSLIGERMDRKQEAIAEITSKWAKAQTIGGPILTIPYEKRDTDEKGKVLIDIKYLHFLPEQLVVKGTLNPNTRYRGIYKATLYNAHLNLAGRFALDKFGSLGIAPEIVRWNDAFISVLIPEMKGIKEYIFVQWNGRKIVFEPGIREGGIFNSGVSAKLPISAEGKYDFSIGLNLNGSEEFNLLPLGQTTSVHLASSWPNPSFGGTFLPENHTTGKDGFTAEWKILDLNRNYPQQWLGDSYGSSIRESAFGVKMFSPVDQYTQILRAVKYIFMFVGLTFLIFFLVEVFNKKRIHPVQYLLIGLALCVFYILLLSLSEHISFVIAYLIAAVSIIGLIGLYVKSSLDGNWLALITGILLAALYVYLYILLENQDYALLMGSLGIFVILAAVMYLSRKVDWYAIEIAGPGEPANDEPAFNRPDGPCKRTIE